MASERNLGDLIEAPEHLVQADEKARAVKPQFDADAIRSLIVVDGTGPIGIVNRRRVQGLSDDDLDLSVREFVETVPVIRQSMSLDEARAALSDAHFNADRIPVVNEENQLVGEVARETLMHEADTQITSKGELTLKKSDGGQIVTLREDMEVRSIDDDKLGKIERVMIEQGKVTQFTVKHGLLSRHHKRIPADTVKAVRNDAVILAIGKMEFGQLADVEELEAERA